MSSHHPIARASLLTLAIAAALSSTPLQAADTKPAPSLSQTSAALGIPEPTVIAHRGDPFNAPESTRPAYLLARDLGADYLELDLQRTKDGQLIALHDNTLTRTTNVADVFPERAEAPVSQFTLAELKQLDAGSWFNKAYPDRARPGFKGLKILTLDEIRAIAEGGPNHPGLYIETKVPAQFPGIEQDLKRYLKDSDWIGATARSHSGSERQDSVHQDRERPSAVNVGYTPGRVILQTFEKKSLDALQQQMPNVPKILLLWGGEGSIPLEKSAPQGANETDADYYARQQVASRADYGEWLRYAKDHGAIGVGPSTVQHAHDGIFSRQFSYMELAAPWMVDMAHEHHLLVHAYTVDQSTDLDTYRQRGVDGFFTNRPAVALKRFGRTPAQSVNDLLSAYGY
ncbi:glycerophosphodiester phosphodiesterase [Larsenimonas suaedae]|uniref:Glycerophosphodiester phosphodiesterase n=1 Tax=Larsenimonas suaedae TaxID=1851019 RepID=A0ABU1GS23_9GAMM|nr:glycerophosphodiester phosphodiesterase [Larsenimonas suaedae]MCM2972372.1 glycerophosphodiester phosphodiesterase [Larsenimonas suaedae]MDR5894832.1 glycerophosphodiester phosphodiesterase [Larsenimonas suaedae]